MSARAYPASRRVESSFLTVVMAAIFALSLVPTGAFASEATKGDIEDTTANPNNISKGTITIANSKAGETYTVYKLFDLASFVDNNTATGQHPTLPSTTEAYSYVIEDGSPWLGFLRGYNKDGVASGSAVPYAVYTVKTDNATGIQGSLSSDPIVDLTEADTVGAYFLVDSETVTLTPNGGAPGQYHVVRPTAKFSNAWDLPNSMSAREANTAGMTAPTADGNVMQQDTTPKYGVIQSFAQEALKYAEATDGIKNDTNYKVAVLTGNATTAPMATLSLGYYLVGTTMGTLASLDTNNLDVRIYEKNDEPALEKKVLKKASAVPTPTSAAFLTGANYDNDGAWVDDTDADIGDHVMFRTVITAQQGAKNFVLHDVMEAGLTFVSEDPANLATATEPDRNTGATSYLPRVYLVRDEGESGNPDLKVYDVLSEAVTIGSVNYAAGSNYSIAAGSDGCTFDVTFNDVDGAEAGNDYVRLAVRPTGETTGAKLVDILDGDKLVVTYWAQVNASARLWGDEGKNETKTGVQYKDGTALDSDDQIAKDDGDERNTNSTVLTYGARSRTAWDKADVTVYRFDIAKTKFEGADNTGTGNYPMLAGAQFSLYKKVDRSEAVSDKDASYTEEVLNTGYAKFTPNGLAAGIDTDVYYSTTKMQFAKDSNGYTYKYKGDKATGGVTALESDGAHEINVQGVEAWDYVLVEDKAPTGYNKLANPIVVTITGDTDNDGKGTSTSPDDSPDNYEGTITVKLSPNDGAAASASTTSNAAWKATVEGSKYVSTQAARNGGVHVINQTGQELPSTGGIGTTIFYVAGTVLVVGAGVMLVAKRRMGSEA